jgi:hypothetical protein
LLFKGLSAAAKFFELHKGPRHVGPSYNGPMLRCELTASTASEPGTSLELVGE